MPAWSVPNSERAASRNIVGPVIRRLREAAGYTQPMLVARLNLGGWDISRETLAKIESQIRWVSDFELIRLADALEVEVPISSSVRRNPRPDTKDRVLVESNEAKRKVAR